MPRQYLSKKLDGELNEAQKLQVCDMYDASWHLWRKPTMDQRQETIAFLLGR